VDAFICTRYLAEFGFTGYFEISIFHGLSDGKIRQLAIIGSAAALPDGVGLGPTDGVGLTNGEGLIA
jgi:hypothetical protein